MLIIDYAILSNVTGGDSCGPILTCKNYTFFGDANEKFHMVCEANFSYITGKKKCYIILVKIYGMSTE